MSEIKLKGDASEENDYVDELDDKRQEQDDFQASEQRQDTAIDKTRTRKGIVW